MSKSNGHTPPATAMNLPYDEEMERAVVGSVLINPTIFLIIAATIKASDFYLLRHQYIFEAMGKIEARKDSISRATVKRQLQDVGNFDIVGGDVYLSTLINSVDSVMYAEQYAELVLRDSIRRKLIQASDEIRAMAEDKSRDIDTAIAESEHKLSMVTDNTKIGLSYKTMSELSSDAIAELEERIQRGDGGLGIPIGYKSIDQLLTGFNKGQLIIGGGRPGMGKTAFAINASINAARMGASIGYFTLEMDANQIHNRRLAIETGMPIQKLTGGEFSERELKRYISAADRLSKLPIYTDDSASLTPSQLRGKAMRIKSQHGLDMLIVDYIGLMHAPGYEGNRVQEMSYISRYLKELARELNIPIFALSQLNRELEKRKDKRPQLSDLRESGSLEQDADIVMFFYRDVVYNEATENPNQADIIIAKHRNGPTDTIPLYFDAPLMKFEEGTRTIIDTTVYM